jgi:hypothetical protein
MKKTGARLLRSQRSQISQKSKHKSVTKSNKSNKSSKSRKSPICVNFQQSDMRRSAFGTHEQQTQLDNKNSEPRLKLYNDYYMKNDTDAIKMRHQQMDSIGQMSTRMPTNTLTSRNAQTGRTLKDKSSQLLQKYRNKKTIKNPTV